MKKILLVDDSSFMRTWVKKILSHHKDIIFIEADNGLKAIDMYKQHIPDCVLMDINMPKLNGIEALKEIKKVDPNAKVVMCSSVGQQKFILESIQSGAQDFIVKPYFHNMVTILHKQLNNR